MAIFYFEEPVTPLSEESSIKSAAYIVLGCWDGCIYPLEKRALK